MALTKEQFRKFAVWFCSIEDRIHMIREGELAETWFRRPTKERQEEDDALKTVLRVRREIVDYLAARFELNMDYFRGLRAPYYLDLYDVDPREGTIAYFSDWPLPFDYELQIFVWGAQQFEKLDPNVSKMLLEYGRALCQWNQVRHELRFICLRITV